MQNLRRELFAGINKFEVLNLENNDLLRINGEVFSNVTALKELNLWFNTLKKIVKEMFSELNQLSILNITHNVITVIDKGVFANLQELDLSSNKIILKKLILFDNYISDIPLDTITNLNKLKLIDYTIK